MKRFALRLIVALVLAFPIGWLLGEFQWFWEFAKSPGGQRVLSLFAVPFRPLDGESFDSPVVLFMLVVGFAVAVLLVWGTPALLRRTRRAHT